MTYSTTHHREQDSGAFIWPVETVAAGGTLNVYGLSSLVATTTGPTFTLPNPVTGSIKGISVSSATSAASNVVVQASTGVQVGVSGDNQITITSTGANAGVVLWGASTSTWAVLGGGTVVGAAQST